MSLAGTGWFQSGLAEVFSGGLEKSQMVQSHPRRPHVVPGGPYSVQLRWPRWARTVPGAPRWSQNGAAEVILSGPEQFQVV